MRMLLWAAVAAALTFAGLDAAAQEFPNKPIRIIVSSAPGGATDITARIIADEMRKHIGQAVIVDNKPGANGVIALEDLARSRPDGHTLMLGNVAHHAITPNLFKKQMTFDYAKGVVAVSRVVVVPTFILGNKDFPAKSFAEFVAHTRANPGKVRYATAGAGSIPHLDMELLAKRAGLKMIELHIKDGGGAMLKELLGGDAQVAFLNLATVLAQVKAGNIKLYAIVAEQRLAEFPDVPTMAEVGYRGVGTIAWQGLFAPAGTPAPILHQLHRALVLALKSDAVQAKFKPSFVQSVPSASPEEAQAWSLAEVARWGEFLKEINLDLSQ
jgi:tripartite-type tricarboxylate transporter receptor subunit TctC